jgi:hypothetical protein
MVDEKSAKSHAVLLSSDRNAAEPYNGATPALQLPLPPALQPPLRPSSPPTLLIRQLLAQTSTQTPCLSFHFLTSPKCGYGPLLPWKPHSNRNSHLLQYRKTTTSSIPLPPRLLDLNFHSNENFKGNGQRPTHSTTQTVPQYTGGYWHPSDSGT